MERIDAGFVDVANPFNANQVKRVPLLPRQEGEEDFNVLIFWTRDPRNILVHAEELIERGFHFYVMVTVTGYPLELEPSMLCTQEALTAMKELAKKIGPDKIVWRYDPVLLTTVTDGEFHRKNFDSLAQSLAGSVKRVIISLYDEYRGAKQRLEVLEKLGSLRMLTVGGNLAELLGGFAKSAEAAGMEIQSCAEKEDFSLYGIKPGACIDAALIEKLWGLEIKGKDKNQRPHCLCCKSVDIGCYGTCAAHCVYCYAWGR
jgi:hypothetical protein